jgi:chromosome segregation protein
MEQFDSIIAQRAEAQQSLETLRAQENEVAADLNEIKVKVATERQRHSLLHHQRQPMEARIAELQGMMDERRNDITNYEDRAAALQVENAEIEANLERLRGSIDEASQGVATLQEERVAVVAAAEEASERLRKLRRDQAHAVEQRGAIEVRITQLELKANAIHDHISKRYTLDLREFTPDWYALSACLRDIGKRVRKFETSSDDAASSTPEPAPAESAPEDTTSEPVAEAAPEGEISEGAEVSSEDGPRTLAPEPVDWARVETLVRELDTRLASMGPVNLDAIQEFEELEQRHVFLETQITDTEKSKTELIEVINKINVTTRTLFAETFEKIRVNFQEMFKELFGGGQANLLLTEGEDPLECGIEIIAKPPGKQLQSISLLSGGEKTMTAVSLLFSIYMVKPSPFCVLDEMDAPLDESNINRFIKILDRFVSQSQFVVISHNKRTIARADALYGVTMEEHGVSKLVGVKFRGRDEAHHTKDILGDETPVAVPSVAESFGKSPHLHSEQLEAEAGGAA